MPKVPAGSGNVVPMQKPPEEVYFAMAAAQMDRQGRLFEPVGDVVPGPWTEDRKGMMTRTAPTWNDRKEMPHAFPNPPALPIQIAPKPTSGKT